MIIVIIIMGWTRSTLWNMNKADNAMYRLCAGQVPKTLK